MKKEIHKIDYNLKDQISTLPALSGDSLQKMGSSAFLMGKFMQSSRNGSVIRQWSITML